jgi:hypothetical protein
MSNKVCVKVSELRKQGYSDFEDWLNNKNNIYVGRQVRIWIHSLNNKRIFHYKSSKWHNPFKVTNEMSLEKSLEEYTDYIIQSGFIHDIKELKGKNLGCWCLGNDCHAKILADIANGKYLSELLE